MSSAATTLVTDLTGFALGEKKSIKEATTKHWEPAAKKLSEWGYTSDLDMPAWQTHSKDTARREYICKVFEQVVTEYVAELGKFLGNADYKEALGDAVKKVVFTCDCFDDNKPRASYEIKDKTLFIKCNCSWLSYSVNPEELTKFLEKSL